MAVPSPIPPPPPEIDFTRSDFWSAERHSARWIMATRAGETRECASQVRTVFRAIKRALGRDTLSLAWTAADTTALYTAVSRAGIGVLVSIPFTRTQTVWTPEMLSIALWYAFGRSVADASGVSVPARTTMPVSGQDPPQDGSAYTDVTPACWAIPAEDVVPVVTPASTPVDTFSLIDWSAADFWSGEPYSARWSQTDPATGTVRNCATQARSLLRLVKSRITPLGYVSASNNGMWTAEYSDYLVRAYVSAGYSEGALPFARTTTTWTPAMLRYAIAVAQGVRPTQIELPSSVLQLPRSDVMPPTDGLDTVVAMPRCTDPRRAGTPAPAPSPPTASPLPVAPVPAPTPGAATPTPVTGPVTLWGSSTCPVCARARAYLDSRRVQYRYMDIAAVATQPSWQAVQRLVVAGGMQPNAVPVLETTHGVLVGFTMEGYDRVLGLPPAARTVSPWLIAGGIAAAGLVTFLLVRAFTTPSPRLEPSAQ